MKMKARTKSRRNDWFLEIWGVRPVQINAFSHHCSFIICFFCLYFLTPYYMLCMGQERKIKNYTWIGSTPMTY